MKKKVYNVMNLTTDELISRVVQSNCKRLSMKSVFLVVSVIAIVGFAFLSSTLKGVPYVDGDTITMINPTAATTSSKKDMIAIPSGVVKANPFLPYRNIGEANSSSSTLPAFELIAPPEVISEGSEAARVMDTMVSGILFDKYSPSAILNIEGNDYLVKKGDVVNNYKVLDIGRDSVTVKLGANTFKAGIGEILTEGSVNVNEVSNLSKKFGGERK